jgi:DNA mismatch repair ATPase MutS
LLLNILMAQKFGLFFGGSDAVASLDPFEWIASGLRLEDTPGLLSLFEREVQFAAHTLKKGGRGFLIFDELFHSTNPPDGERTADLFLESLWTKRNLTSMISTHVFSLAENAPNYVLRLCVPAKKMKDGSLQFDYTVQQGICKVSSVDLVFEKCGFPRSRKT